MKKKNRVFAALLCVFLLAAGTAGCGSKAAEPEKLTAESLIRQVQEKTDAMQSMETHADILIDMSGEALSSIGGSLSMDMDLDMQSTSDPIASYVKGTLTALIMNTDIESYTVLGEKDELLTYVGNQGQWTLQRVPFDQSAAESLDNSAVELLKNIDSITLAEETVNVDGIEAYLLSGTITGEDVTELMGAAGSIVGDYTGGSQIDLSGLSVDIEYAVSKDDILPLYTDLTFHGTEGLTGTEEVQITGMTMKMTYTGYDTVDSITVPQEVIDKAQEIDVGQQ